MIFVLAQHNPHHYYTEMYIFSRAIFDFSIGMGLLEIVFVEPNYYLLNHDLLLVDDADGFMKLLYEYTGLWLSPVTKFSATRYVVALP